MRRVVALFLLILATGILLQWVASRLGDIEPPTLDLEQWWGVGAKPRNYETYVQRTSTINEFHVATDQKIIAELTQQLNNPSLRLPRPLEGVGFEYGFNSDYLRQLIAYWRDNYLPRWAERESILNTADHYTTEIQGLKMHFLHTRMEKSKGRNHYALLLLHGWPSSVLEFYSLIRRMKSTEGAFTFDIVVPSLPGYGWSEGAARPGLGSAQIAVIMRNLMVRLGYHKFFVHGGDVGYTIGSNLATLFPEQVIGFHSNMCVLNSLKSMVKGYIASLLPRVFAPAGFEDLFFSETRGFAFIIEESGYFHLQATKPDTIGTALSANPVGLAAYILEKFSTWTNPENRKLPDGGLSQRFDLDALLDNLMIYYLTNSITTSQRWYAENFSRAQRALQLERVPTNVPTGCARFKHEIMHSLDFQLKDKFKNIVHSTYYGEGGHFAAAELPEIVYKDFIEFVKKVERFQQKLANV